jgi:putative transposase
MSNPAGRTANNALEVALNLASRLTLTGMNQLWVADITYIRLRTEFVYLAVMLDAYSRKVVGWALDRTLAAQLPIAALTHALAERHPPPGLVTIPIVASSMRPRST